MGAQKLTRCANSKTESLELLEPVSKDWHCRVTLLTESKLISKVHNPARPYNIEGSQGVKEKNREMTSFQSLVSALMYYCHCEKQV